MTTQNTDPYTSPQSDIGDVDAPEYAEVKVFSFSGRIGRIRYLAYSIGLTFIISLGGALIAAIFVPEAAGMNDVMAGGIAGLLMVVVYAFMLVASFVLAVRRLNDFDTSGWMSLLFLVPIVNIILGLALWFVPGTQGANRFGLQPPPNSGGMTFLALLLPIIMLIGILAAVAIPAYHQYSERAAEMQSQ
jgi:uncharacterized membrane protein YhaH (DUF805 family)